jgi:hypothetical protein
MFSSCQAYKWNLKCPVLAHIRTLRVAKLVKIGQKTKIILILLDNYSVQMYRFRPAFSKIILPSIWLVLFAVCLMAPYAPELVAKFYSQGLFKYGTIGLRFLIGSLPFAIGELVYIIIVILLIINLIKQITLLKNFNQYWQKIRFLLINLAWLGLRLYVVFQFIWGFNYLQPDPSKDFQLSVQPPKNAQIAISEMNALTYDFIEELNQTKAELLLKKGLDPNFEQIVANVQQAYEQVAVNNTRFILQHPSIKKAIFPNLGDYIGFLAFYQPITGEAILRSDLPILTQPYTIAHEMAHQLGYASETEANFIAFVVATESNDPYLRYSMLLQMFSYAQDAQLLLLAGNNGFDAWKVQIQKNKALLSPAVLKDRANIKAFFAARANKQIQASSQLYDQFLKWNQQAAGLASYADVLKWVRAYRIKTDSSTSYSR